MRNIDFVVVNLFNVVQARVLVLFFLSVYNDNECFFKCKLLQTFITVICEENKMTLYT